ncbi:DUF38 domain-containing protein [Caenorhabditis elegans]|nr:DUF38 domain-containing protein [Caenorhabditis elegans]CTQ86792.1 DUF38 domain-containing protein [Caenorhabditis elegans]|eukprot:NP_001300093.1 F-box A protein [Caenorhabditis elegans]
MSDSDSDSSVEENSQDPKISLKMCHSLEAAVIEFGIRFDAIAYDMREDHIRFIYNHGPQIKYTEAENGGTTVKCNGQKRIEAENFVDRAFKDMKIALKNVETFEINNDTKEKYNIVKHFTKAFKSEESIHTKAMIFDRFSIRDTISILSRVYAQTLENIHMWHTDIRDFDQFERMIEMDQWKNAKKCTIWESSFDTKYTENLFHFDSFTIYQMSSSLKTQLAIKIRDDVMTRSTFEYCNLRYYETVYTNSLEIAKVFKPDYEGGADFEIEYDNGSNKFKIEFKVSCSPHSFTIKRC